MCPTKYGLLDELRGEFSFDSAYSELPSLPPKLTANVTSLSGSAVGLGGLFLPSVGHAQFEFLLLLPTAVGVTVSGEVIEILVRVSGFGAR